MKNTRSRFVLFAAALAAAALVLTGCTTIDKLIPEGSAEFAEIKAAGPLGATEMTVTNFSKTDTEVTADEINATVHSVAQPIVQIHLKKYRRVRR